MCRVTISVFEFMQMFPNEEEAIKWFQEKRWGGSPVCPKCGTKNITPLKNKEAFLSIPPMQD